MSGRPIDVSADLHRSVTEAAAALATTRSDIVARALNEYLPTITPPPAQSQLGDYPSLPRGYHRSATRIYNAIVDLGGGPISSALIAQHLGLHRGNVDRHLTRLRSDGYVERTPVGHRVLRETERQQAHDTSSPQTG